jgi:ribonuclease P protein component
MQVAADVMASRTAQGLPFPPRARLLKHADFERVYREGRRHYSDNLAIFFLPRQSGAGPRVGFTVGRAAGGAVQRNRIRRRLREAVRLELGQLPVAVDVVINPRRSVLAADFADLRAEVARAFEKIGGSGRR